ncbi:MAG: PEP-CTERM sorting domain-containing protein [Gammaproteobacteria bacterium]|nr:PEP-CTERM sorting domain-containing protein [Gammaproteobacteria bacterium]
MKLNVSSPPLRMLVLAGLLAAAAPLAAQTAVSNTEAATTTLVIGPGAPEFTFDAGPTTAGSTAASVLGAAGTSADGEATVLGEVKARATAVSASEFDFGNSSATAGWTATLTTTGIDPGVPVPLDLTIAIDGNLFVNEVPDPFGFGSPAASMELLVSFFATDGTEINVFGAGATLSGSGDPSLDPVLVTAGDWAAGDVSDPVCVALLGCTSAISTLVDLDGALDVAFGTVFDLFVILNTTASVFGSVASASSEFFDTVSLSLTTPLAGLSIELVAEDGGPGTPVPEPTTALLVLLGLAGLRARRRL